MWPVLFNGMAVGFAFQLCHRLHQDRLNHRPAYTDPCVTWLPPANTLANTGAIILELCQSNPNWLAVLIDLCAIAFMLPIRRHMAFEPAPVATNSRPPIVRCHRRQGNEMNRTHRHPQPIPVGESILFACD